MNQSQHMLQFAGTPYGNIMYLVNCTDAQWQEILDMMAKSNEYTNDVCKKANDLWEEDNRLMDQCKIDGDPKTLEESIKYKEQADLWEKKTYALVKTPQFNADVFIEYAERNGITYDTQITWDGNKGMVRRADKYKGEPKIDWVCKDRRKGKKGNGCKNLIIPEEELLEALTEALGAEWNGIDSVDERIFDNLKTVKIYDDGRIEVDLNEEKKTA